MYVSFYSSCQFRSSLISLEIFLWFWLVCPPSSIVANSPGQCSALINYTAPTAADNCAIESVVLASGYGSDSIFPLGNTTVRYFVNDTSGLSSHCSFFVDIQDREAPTLSEF